MERVLRRARFTVKRCTRKLSNMPAAATLAAEVRLAPLLG